MRRIGNLPPPRITSVKSPFYPAHIFSNMINRIFYLRHKNRYGIVICNTHPSGQAPPLIRR